MVKKVKQLKQSQKQKQIINIHLGNKKSSNTKRYNRKPAEQSYTGNFHPVYIESAPRQEPLSNMNAVLQTIAELRNEMKPKPVQLPEPVPKQSNTFETQTPQFDPFQKKDEEFVFENPMQRQPKKRRAPDDVINEAELREGFYGFTSSGRIRTNPLASQVRYMRENNISSGKRSKTSS